ncbi:uncharacterized protein AB675_4429 [Cyphellophora attinorum]|uniref:Zn(2)-C6 fungal-type domain-containing protein n=1 Tax=Cyphellophora attinorum TaxID=1664694 RepID=A0A0N1NY39_9EURO|nr:uncharacterized protein AB675_4429 [Phialophora attinorum]KPI36507.1 hypothetical protein AB675_4429 [Phialophora attinorum]
MGIHDGRNARNADLAGATGASIARQSHRVQRACRTCAEKKLKCTEDKPCERCKEKQIECVPVDLDDQSQSQSQNPPQPSMNDSLSHGVSASPPGDDNLQDDDEMFMVQPSSEYLAVADDALAIFPVNEAALLQQEPMMQDILGGSMPFPVPDDSVQFDQDSTFEAMDFFCLDGPLEPWPALPAPITPQSITSPKQSTISLGAGAYSVSGAFSTWIPRKDDGHDLDEQDLVLQGTVDPSPQHGLSLDGLDISKEALSPMVRDELLAMVLGRMSKVASKRIIRSFPPNETLRDLIYMALTHMRQRQIGHFIHLASFDLNTQRPELLGALVAYGATISSSPEARKFGYALQNIVRMAINQLAQQEHVVLRDLDVAQAFYIQTYLGYWSSANRLIELVESGSMLGVTMLRKGKMLQAESYYTLDVILDLPGLSLQQKWLMWIEQESAKRLVHFAASLDFQVALVRETGALFTYEEIQCPLPMPARLWEAANATEWRNLLDREPALKMQQPPPLNKVLWQPSLLAKCTGSTDTRFCAYVYLSSFWILVKDYWRMASLLPETKAASDFVLTARHSELLGTLDTFKAECTDEPEVAPEILLLQEAAYLHLSAWVAGIAHYCGGKTDFDARAAAGYVQRWHSSKQCRAAVWHAGQIIRAARLFPMRALTDIYATALYHAGLVLWIWGLLYRAQGTYIASPDAPTLAIDGNEVPDTTRFLQSGRCRPMLTDQAGKPFSLESPALATELVRDILADNWGQEPMAPTPREAFRFMQAFSKITRQQFNS